MASKSSNEAVVAAVIHIDGVITATSEQLAVVDLKTIYIATMVL